MEYESRLIYQSNYWYNDGLKRAGIRDLTGAIASFKRSLQYNRSNLAARNLLGLAYYGRGDVVEALVEWIISRNFGTEDNIANYFIEKLQEVPGELENINEAVKRYNQGLAYAQQDAVDMAIIQLKKAVDLHPTFVKAHQLLCLLYTESGQYSNARSSILTAHKLDTTDPITLKYMYELNQVGKERSTKAKNKDSKQDEQTVTYNLGNETIIQPATPTVRENTGWHTALNIGIGLLVGVAVMWFLVMPAIISSRQSSINDETVAFSEKIATEEAQISALKTELEDYRSTTVESENAPLTAESTQEAYETLLSLQNDTDGEMTTSDRTDTLLNIETAALGEKGMEVYNTLGESLFPEMCSEYYAAAQESYEASDYGEAIIYLEKVIQMDETYDDGGAYLLMGQCYQQQGDEEQANTYFQQVMEDFPDTENAEAAREAMGVRGNRLSGDEEDTEGTTEGTTEETGEETEEDT